YLLGATVLRRAGVLQGFKELSHEYESRISATKPVVVILSAAKNQVGRDAVELRRPKSPFVILSVAKNLVLQHMATLFFPVFRYKVL
ncbi:MAG: hypothetical protein M3437_16285, partial [Chloroflexota bacterium]|nr:hypothetical protein [Chloroflexota bacterium]